MMIEISNKIKIQQIIEVINNDTNEISYLIMNDTDKEWKHITQEEYNNIRGYNNGE